LNTRLEKIESDSQVQKRIDEINIKIEEMKGEITDLGSAMTEKIDEEVGKMGGRIDVVVKIQSDLNTRLLKPIETRCETIEKELTKINNSIVEIHKALEGCKTGQNNANLEIWAKISEHDREFESIKKDLEEVNKFSKGFDLKVKDLAVFPLTEINGIQHSQGFQLKNFELELFKSNDQFFIQAEDTVSSKIYTSKITKDNIKDLTSGVFSNIEEMHSGFVSGLEGKQEVSLSISEDAKITVENKKAQGGGGKKPQAQKFTLELKKVTDTSIVYQRHFNKLKEAIKGPLLPFGNHVLKILQKIAEQEKKTLHNIDEAIFKIDQLEKNFDEVKA
jgi:hypothetical protein